MPQLRFCKAAQVALHIHGVFIHGIHMEQVMLHLRDDAAKHRDVASQDAVAVHAPQATVDTFFGL